MSPGVIDRPMDTTELIPVCDKINIVNTPTGGRFPMAFSFLRGRYQALQPKSNTRE